MKERSPTVQLSAVIKPIDEIIISAQLGWAIVSPEFDDDETNSECRSLWRAPVIAWLVQLYRRSTDETTFVDVVPVTVNGNLGDTQDFALQYRDRGPFFTISEEFEDEAALLVHFSHNRAMMRVMSQTKSRQPGTSKATPTRRSGVVNA